ncbi:arylesterase [Usitatibacter palustris]|uniref:arylesterase n=1 Tax=Usitatibacter palustris TaxID=2732487 RepID=UPI001488F766|nr:arylesterase [Usitatibacter palustris]
MIRPCFRALSRAFLLLVLAAPALGAQTVLVFGDSLSAAYGLAPSQGWVALLAKKLAAATPAWNVVNASVSGETTAGGLRRLPEDLKRHKPDVVVIALGANDALRGQPLAAARANLEQMIRLARQARAEPVLVGLMIPPNYGIDYAREFQELFGGVAKKEKVPLVPFLLEGVADKSELFLPDQLHPNAQAQARILDNVWPVVAPVLKKRKP